MRSRSRHALVEHVDWLLRAEFLDDGINSAIRDARVVWNQARTAPFPFVVAALAALEPILTLIDSDSGHSCRLSEPEDFEEYGFWLEYYVDRNWGRLTRWHFACTVLELKCIRASFLKLTDNLVQPRLRFQRFMLVRDNGSPPGRLVAASPRRSMAPPRLCRRALSVDGVVGTAA